MPTMFCLIDRAISCFASFLSLTGKSRRVATSYDQAQSFLREPHFRVRACCTQNLSSLIVHPVPLQCLCVSPYPLSISHPRTLHAPPVTPYIYCTSSYWTTPELLSRTRHLPYQTRASLHASFIHSSHISPAKRASTR